MVAERRFGWGGGGAGWGAKPHARALKALAERGEVRGV